MKSLFVYFSLERIGIERVLFTLCRVFPLQCSLVPANEKKLEPKSLTYVLQHLQNTLIFT